MRRTKPADWPRHMEAKPLASGDVAYYWNVPSWARRGIKRDGADECEKCPLVSAALGTDYGTAIVKAKTYNGLLDAWRKAGAADEPPRPSSMVPGTIDWLIAVFQRSDEYKNCDASTRTWYDDGLKLVADYILPKSKTRQRFGTTPIVDIERGHAQTLYKNLQDGGKTPERITTAAKAMASIRRAWNVAHGLHSRIVPAANPFARMNLGSTGEETPAATLGQLEQFTAKANEMGHPSIALAAMVAYYWLQRETDIVKRLNWSDYEPGVRVKVRHHKNRSRKDKAKRNRKGDGDNVVWLPLTEDGVSLFPEIEDQIAVTPRRGPLMVMRDKVDARRKSPQPHMPYTIDYFGGLAREILDAAGLTSISFESFRHGGMTEAGDSSATDAEMMSGSGHKTRAMLTVYTKRTNPQAASLAKKRLAYRVALRTKSG